LGKEKKVINEASKYFLLVLCNNCVTVTPCSSSLYHCKTMDRMTNC